MVLLALSSLLLGACGDVPEEPAERPEYATVLQVSFETWQDLRQRQRESAEAFDEYLTTNPDDMGEEHDQLYFAWETARDEADRAQAEFEGICEALGLDPSAVARDLSLPEEG